MDSRAKKINAYILPRTQDILFLAIFTAALLLGPLMLNMDGDLPKHLAIGKYVLEGNLPPTNDIFSYTRYGVPFAPHKWLSGVLFYIAYILFMEKGIVILSGILLATTFTLVYKDAISRTGLRFLTFFMVALGAAITSLHWISRPHLFTMLFLAIWLVWNEKLASEQNIPLWYFPVGMLLWNNLHGEFISGFLITIAYMAGWAWDYIFNRAETKLETGKRIGKVLGMITIVTILNPVSFRAWSTVTSWMGNQYLMENTQETASPNFLGTKFIVVLAFIALSIILLAIKHEKMPVRHGLILAGFTTLTLLSARNVHIYGVVAPFVLVSTLKPSQDIPLVRRYETLLKKFDTHIRFPVWPSITVVLSIVLLSSSTFGNSQRFSPGYFPVQATEWIREHPQKGNMFNTFDWGGYISFMLWPENLVFIDSQGDVYGEAFIREYEQVVALKPGWGNVLDKYHTQWAMIPSNWPLVTALKNEGWSVIYSDQTATILRRVE